MLPPVDRSPEMSAEEKDGGFIILFNGKDLNNWRVVGNNVWSVENGTMVCHGLGRSWIHHPTISRINRRAIVRMITGRNKR